MKRSRKAAEGKSPIEMLEEAVHLIRSAGISSLWTYYVGSLPFMLALLQFWSEMSRDPFAPQRLPQAALTLTGLFVWMKVWQTIYTQRLWGALQGGPLRGWDWRRIAGVTANQIILQPLGLFLLPVALALLVPFGWFYAFYQGVTIFGGGEDASVKTVFRKAKRQALLWPGQNNFILAICKGFGLVVFLNLGVCILGVAYLLFSFFGIETPFSRSSAAFLNTTFFAMLAGLTYLCLDPVIKVVYVLRCFYGESLESGEDLKADLRRFKVEKGIAIAALVIFCFAPASLRAAPAPPPAEKAESVQPSALDRSIDEVIKRKEYTWRFPRERSEEETASKSVIREFFESILKTLGKWLEAVGKAIKSFWNWLTRGSSPKVNLGGANWDISIRALITLLAAACVGLLVWLLIKIWRNYRPDSSQALEAEAVAPTPDLNDENVAADQLPEDGWSRLARELLGRGEWRLALRAFYLASLAHLAERNLITIARWKSNQEYQRELGRRAHALPEVAGLFSENVSVFDRVWYGLHAVDEPMLEVFSRNVERMKGAS